MHKGIVFSLRGLVVFLGSLGIGLELYKKGLYMLTYYTLLSNILVVGFSLYLLKKMLKDYQSALTNRGLLRLKGAVTIAIMLTFLVYHFMLAPLATPEKYYQVENFLVHYIVPILFFLDWLLVDKRGQYQRLDPILWCLVPALYSIGALIKGYFFQIEIPGQVNSPYPYFFLNIDRFGFLGVFQFMVGILLGYLVLGLVLYGIKMYKAGKA